MSYQEYRFASATGSTLSNFHLCSKKLKIWGLEFSSSEQGYQYFKALFHHRLDIATQILNESSSLRCYRLGKRVKTSKLWRAEKVLVMQHILRHKLYQCQEFRAELLCNKDKVFVESTNNRFWGRNEQGKGLNTLGVLLHSLVGYWELECLFNDRGCE